MNFRKLTFWILYCIMCLLIGVLLGEVSAQNSTTGLNDTLDGGVGESITNDTTLPDNSTGNETTHDDEGNSSAWYALFFVGILIVMVLMVGVLIGKHGGNRYNPESDAPPPIKIKESEKQLTALTDTINHVGEAMKAMSKHTDPNHEIPEPKPIKGQDESIEE